MKYLSHYMVLIVLLGISAGCSNLPPRHPVPADDLYRAQILPGVPAVRAWAGNISETFANDFVDSVRQEMQASIRKGGAGVPTINVLTLSGGADHGAFGAGFLNGWSQSGTRPQFKFVTGVSTGAIIAPFAFLGAEYDAVLKEGFTTIRPEDVYLVRGLSILWSDSLADSAPLEALINKYVNEDILHAVAEAHRQGRRLYIGTTNMDADRLVVWNMGAIANSGHAEALQLFRKVILASSSIPLTFPPVLIKVKVDGVTYDEMHADGGVKAQLFLTAATINITDIRKQLGLQKTSEERTKLFIIRNAAVGPEYEPVPQKLTNIMDRALTLLVKSHARNDLDRLHNFAHEHGFGFNWVSLPNEFTTPQAEPFDTTEMNRLFNTGYEMGLKGNAWRKEPPGIGKR
ncbi:MAG: patatin-like phospholipase family protein [Gammaproteobacteria bacterium]|nr:patatin-like phospholipase family protein [Gammaproteobacteria bacterium]